jgi:hypothetical protein
MNAPPTARPEYETAPPIKRANPDRIPVRLHSGILIAHVSQELADRLVMAGAADVCRRGPRRYLRLRAGINIPRTDRGWDIIEFLRRWHGDKQAAGYIAHKDRQSEWLSYLPSSRARKFRLDK